MWKYHICLGASTFSSAKLIKKLLEDKNLYLRFFYYEAVTKSRGFSSRKRKGGDLK